MSEQTEHTADFARFHNRLRMLINIDKYDVDQVLEASMPATEWEQFRENPWRWFVSVGRGRAQAVFGIILAREQADADRAAAL